MTTTTPSQRIIRVIAISIGVSSISSTSALLFVPHPTVTLTNYRSFSFSAIPTAVSASATSAATRFITKIRAHTHDSDDRNPREKCDNLQKTKDRIIPSMKDGGVGLRSSLMAMSFACLIATMTFSYAMLPSFAAEDGTSSPVDITSKTIVSTSDASSATLPQPSTAYDETWNLIKKYALDQTFHGQDWEEAYTKYSRGILYPSSPAKSVGQDEIMKATINLVTSLGDKYSRILDKDEYARIQKFDLIGVGATLMPDPLTKEIIVGAPPVSKSASDMAGLQVGDVVVAVNGVKTAGRTAFDIIDQITEEDPRANTITFTIRRGSTMTSNDDDSTPTMDYTMKREFLEVKDPISYRISETRPDGTKVGYVRIAEFNSLVKPSLEAALISLESQNVNAYVLDVRGNPGGAFQSAIEIAGLFINDKLATDVVDGNGIDLKFRTAKDRVVVDANHPLAVWVDGGSASASEVLAGALRDNCRAVVMGSTSFGKGLVQAVYGLNNGYGLVLTVAKYLTPEGTDINKVGIIPDVSKDVALPSVPRFVPLLGSDTSRVNFNDVKERMTMCSTNEK